MSKAKILAVLSKATGLSKSQVDSVFEELLVLMGKTLKEQGEGSFSLPGMMKVRVIHKPATEARKGINPFTGEETMFKAKPARSVVKVQPLKRLRELV